ncbi:MAG: aconitate hydratase [Myxococcota bacterium]|jgi:aconitate hydratase|nr:aconitate hydratase [Myxococcota bacterium]
MSDVIGAIRKVYERQQQSHDGARQRLGRALTYTEKVLFNHLDEPRQDVERGKAFLMLRPDRVALQDATAQMALLQFMLAGRSEAAVPTTVHCDHLIRARLGASQDLAQSLLENDEVFRFLRDVSMKYGIGFWKPGAGIIHQVVLENYAFPGGLMIGTDSHTPNAGGLGMFASGVGGADAVDVMVGMPWEVLAPKVIGVKLVGKMSGWTAPKDVITKLCAILTVKGGTNAVLEYFGEGARSISCTGKGTITNMGAELGATTSIFPYDQKMSAYLRSTERAELAELADAFAEGLCADPEVEAEPERFFDRVVEIDLSTLQPQIVGPHTPDLGRDLSVLGAEAQQNNWPIELSAALIGSCTNSSYEDIGRAAHVAKQAKDAGLKVKVPFMVTPGSELIHQTIRRDELMQTLLDVGAIVLANACGPCIGQWQRDDIKKGERNSILTSYNRNFARRNDGNAETHAFIGSPEIVTALAFSGRLDFDPARDALQTSDGKAFRFVAPEAPELPARGFAEVDGGFVASDPTHRGMKIDVNPMSDRLQLLEPFPAWQGAEFQGLRVLLKAKGKCTTDHISAAGPWLKYRGHLPNISGNLFLGAVDAFTGQSGKTTDVLSGEEGITYPQLAARWKAQGVGWVAVGDENYGEGSSREHAAMEPRFMGGVAIITKSFARIHETNLKKQGMLPLCFVNPNDYDKLRADDLLDTEGVVQLAPDSLVYLVLRHADGSSERIALRHTFNQEQIAWFKAGSALNLLRSQASS